MTAGAWVEYLTPEECWEALDHAYVGRIGVVVDSAPEIYPVNHVVDGRTIVFRTDPGSKLHGMTRTPSVCFEIDGADPEAQTGWSVLVKGHAVEITVPGEIDRVAALPLRLWSVGGKHHWIRIVPDEVTGRRIQRPA